MIEESIKIHDKFSVELKIGYKARMKKDISDFALNTWIFIPNSLDINPLTYQKTDFYKDLKSNIRLITPVFLLRDIAGKKSFPMQMLETSFTELASNPSRTHRAEYEYHVKMFLSIFKSALGKSCNHIAQNETDEDKVFLIQEYIDSVHKITRNYRSLKKIINAPTISKELYNVFLFGDEFMSNVVEKESFRLLRSLEKSKDKEIVEAKERLIGLIHNEIEYKETTGIPIVDKKDKKRNRELIFRMGLLKKYAENELFLTANKKREGILTEQIYYSIAAGLAMVFATAVAFSFQQKYGNFTMPFFVALVVSYMLKDRIKELARYYFAHRLGKRYFDHKTRISLKGEEIGWSKEAMDFVTDEKLPPDVLRIRDRSTILEAHNKSFSEKIILYRKLVRIRRNELDNNTQYNTSGIHDIIRYNLSSLITKMDDPDFPLFIPDEEAGYKVIQGERIYFLNLILQMKSEEQLEYKRYRVVFNRNGIQDIERF